MNHRKPLIDHLESMPFDQARKEVTDGTFATVGSPDYDTAVSWLKGKEQERRDAYQKKTFRIAIIAMINAVVATILAIIAILI